MYRHNGNLSDRFYRKCVIMFARPLNHLSGDGADQYAELQIIKARIGSVLEIKLTGELDNVLEIQIKKELK